MIKNLLSILAVASVVTVNAQSTGKIVKANVESSTISNNGTSVSKSSVLPVTTITVSALTGTSVGVFSAGSDTATPGCSPNAGYVFGSNCYGDLEKAQYFTASSYSSVTSASITGGVVFFYKNATKGTGGAAATPVSLKFYAGTSNTVAPGSTLGSAVASMSTIVAAQTGTATIYPFVFNLASAVPVSGAFYASLVVPTTAGDTAVVASETAAVNNAWEKWNDNSWHSIPSAWGASLKVNLAIFPIISGSTTASGISTNAGLSKEVRIMPNPSTGVFNVLATLATSNDLSISVTNALGQVIHTEKHNSVMNELFVLDLSAQNTGVYFVTISNGTDKMVQRLILNK